MKVPLPWLKEYLPTKLAPEHIAESLTIIGLEVEGIQDDVLEVALTPNLAHCASVRGIARELSAVTGESIHHPKFTVVEMQENLVHKHIAVSVENATACPRYACRIITGLRVAPSPDWLKNRIELCGMRSINNIVDITNLVLLEFGHPLHAFDLDKLEGKRLVVRNAHFNEKIVTLDGKEHFPSEETLLICDAHQPAAIAGIMGSANTEVTDATTSILLESAYFEPTTIRRAAKRMGIRSEASYRFERGTDPNGVLEALERATSWICDIAGGTALHGTIDIKGHDFPKTTLSCRLSRINRILGTQLAMSEVETIFRRLNLQPTSTHEDTIVVSVPTYRHDLHQEIDLVEEVARLYGYDHIRKKEGCFFRTGSLPHSPDYLFEKQVRCRLIAEGLQEFLTCDLISPMQAALISTDNFPSRTLIKLLNPHSIEQSVMRPSMLPGMLSVVKYNADHAIYSIAGFEVGRVHFTSKGRYLEPSTVAIILSGQRAEEHWGKKAGNADFFDLKGIIENLLVGLKIPQCTFSPSTYTNFHPGRQAAIMFDNIEAGIIGEIHPLTLKDAGIEHRVFFAELNVDELRALVKDEVKMKPLPQFPASTRDWTVTVPDQYSVGHIMKWIENERSELLESFTLLDLYRSDKLGSNRKNLTFRFVYRDRSKTISLSAVENEHLRITNTIDEHLKQELA